MMDPARRRLIIDRLIFTLLLTTGAVLTILPWLFGKVSFVSSGVIGFDGYGAWLQGALTPLALAIAALTFSQQSKAQSRANELASQSNLLGNIERFTGHINYLCMAAIRGNYINRNEVKDGDAGFEAMTAFLRKHYKATGNPHFMGVSKSDIVESEPFKALKSDIERIYKVASDAGFEIFLDRRVIEIRILLENFY